MKFTLFIFSLFFLQSQGLFAQLTPFQQEEKWGYKNDQEEVVIEPIYDFAEPFKEGKAKVGLIGNPVWWDGWHQRDSYGVINPAGEEIIPLQYTALEFQRDGLIKVRETPINSDGEYTYDPDDDSRKNDDLWGYIDEENSVIVPIKYEYLGNFYEDDPSGQLVFGGIDYYKWGVINRQGEEIVPCTLRKKPKAPRLTTGFYYIQQGKKNGILDASGKIIIEPIYDHVSATTAGGFIWVTEEKQQGVFDWDGKVVVPMAYDRVWPASTVNYFSVKRDAKVMLIKAYETAPFTEGFDELKTIKHRWYQITNDDKFGLMNANGKVVFPAKYEAIKLYEDGTVRFKVGTNFGLADTSQNLLVKVDHSTLYHSSFGYSFVSNEFVEHRQIDMPSTYTPTDFGVIDRKGKKLIKPGKYDDFVAFNESFVWGKKDDKWYLISLKNGKPFIKEGFDDLGGFDDQPELIDRFNPKAGLTQEQQMVDRRMSTVAAVKRGSMWGAVNHQGELILACEYDKIEGEYDRVRVKKDGLWGVFKSNGAALVPFKYESLQKFRKPFRGEGIVEAKFWNPDGETGGYLDLDGNERAWE